MLKYTLAAITKISEEVKQFLFMFTVLPQVVYIGYIIYAICVDAGYLWANIAFGVISAAYLSVYVITYGKKDKYYKELRHDVKHIKAWIILPLKAVTIATTIYGIFVATSHTNTITVVLAAFSVVLWGVQLIFEIADCIIEDKLELLKTALIKDFEPVIKTKNTITSALNWVKGVDEEPEEIAVNQRKVSILEREIERKRAAKAAKKAAQSAAQNTEQDFEPAGK